MPKKKSTSGKNFGGGQRGSKGARGAVLKGMEVVDKLTIGDKMAKVAE